MVVREGVVGGSRDHVDSPAFSISLAPGARVAEVRGVGEGLTGADATALVEALAEWFGADQERFGVFADLRGVVRVDAEYRRESVAFFRRERARLFVAAYHMGPVIRVVAEMFRLGSGIELRAFADPEPARRWLRSCGLEI